MPKSVGDQKHNRAKSVNDMIGSFADSLRTPDANFDRLYNFQPFPAQMPFFAAKEKVKFIVGGNRSGKTSLGVIEDIMIYTGIIPKALVGIYPHVIPSRPRLVRIILMSYTKHLPETIRPMLDRYLPESWSHWNEQEHIYYGPDGSKLSIMAIDPSEDVDPAMLRSADVDHTHIDEINTEVVFTESFTRGAALKDGPKSLSLTYCPQNGMMSWEYERLWKKVFHPISKQYLPPDEKAKDIFGLRLTMKDNPLITEEEREKMIGNMRNWEIAIRVDGDYSEKTTSPYFKVEHLFDWNDNAPEIREGMYAKVIEKRVDADKGIFEGKLEVTARGKLTDAEPYWQIWEEPKDRQRYVMVIDSSEGNMESDPNVVDVYNASDKDKPYQVAQLRMKYVKPGEIAVQAACMANIYGDCLLVPETNNTAGGIVIDRLRNYRNLYQRIAGGEKRQIIESERLGWRTDSANKPTSLETLYKAMLELYAKKFCPIRSRQTLYDMMSFEERVVKDKMGRFVRIEYGAKSGQNDDCVTVLWIAFRIIKTEYHKITLSKIREKSVSSVSLDVDNKIWRDNIIANEKKGRRCFQELRPVQHICNLRNESFRRQRLCRQEIAKRVAKSSMNT